MATPVFRQISGVSLVIQLVIVALIYYGLRTMGWEDPFFAAAVIYAAYALTMRNLVAGSHRKGMKLSRKGLFAEAIPYFQKSFDFFNKYRWVDNFRAIILFSASGLSYREMAWCNIAFCYSQIGEGVKAIEYYNLVIDEYPKNMMAVTSLKMLTAVSDNAAK